MSHNKLSSKQTKLIKLIINYEGENAIEKYLKKHFKKHQCNGTLSRSNSLAFRFLENCYLDSNTNLNVVCTTLIERSCPETLSTLCYRYGYLPRQLNLELDFYFIKGPFQYMALREWFQMCILSLTLIPQEVKPPDIQHLKHLWHLMAIYLNQTHTEHFETSILFKSFRQYMRQLFSSSLINDETLIIDYFLFMKELYKDDEFQEDFNRIILHNPIIKQNPYFLYHQDKLSGEQSNTTPITNRKNSSLKIEEHNECEQEHFDFKTL